MISHKPTGHLSQWAARLFITPGLISSSLTLTSMVVSILTEEKEKALLTVSRYPRFYVLLVALWGSPAEPNSPDREVVLSLGKEQMMVKVCDTSL